MLTDLSRICISGYKEIHEAVSQMNDNRLGILLVVAADGTLSGAVSDGDIRRAILAQVDFSYPVTALLERKAGSPPITAPAEADRSTLLSLFRKHTIQHLPLMDKGGRVVGLATMDEFLPGSETLSHAVIMAGGLGTRLRPLTEDMPKSMLPVSGRPLMEITIEQLRSAGIRHVNVATHHQSEKITEHFGDGRDFGVELSYMTEDQALGTAGALGLMDPPSETMLVINGDILTQVDFNAMFAYHREHNAELTVGVHQYQFQVPYGVVECEGPFVRDLTEKPMLESFVNAGIYLLEPAVIELIPSGEPFDMTDLIQRLLGEGRPVASFPIHEYWLDVGHHDDYRQAQRDAPGLKSAPGAPGGSPGAG